MLMQHHLIDTFKYNDYANRKVLEKIRQLPDQTEAVKLFSHLINSMNKWIARLDQFPQAPKLDWWEPAYPLGELEDRWGNCLQAWLTLLGAKTEDEVMGEVKVVGDNGVHYATRLMDIALQLNYHSIHHRANIQAIIRAQGLEPDFVDYIGSAYRKL
jgi:uncharacterized damage-inducible protein DinB